MSSILTNNSAMVALQTLKSVNTDLAKTQAMISTGKAVASAKDNAAVWAISKVMEADVRGYRAINDSLALGQSTVALARNGAEKVTELLTSMKERIVTAQGKNVDRGKLQADVTALADQVKSVVNGAQFYGLNLLKGNEDVDIMSSLDRNSDGVVSVNNIAISRQDLSFDSGTYGTGADLGANVTTALGGNKAADGTGGAFSGGANKLTATVAGTIVAGETYNIQVADKTVSFMTTTTAANDLAAGLTAAVNAAGIEGISANVAADVITINSTSKFSDVAVNTSGNGAATFALTANGNTAAAATNNSQTITARASELTFSTTAGVSAGDGYRATIGGANYDYVAGKGETFEDVARGLKSIIDGAGVANISTNVRQNATTGAWTLQIDNDGTALTLTDAGRAGGKATGGLVGLDKLDVRKDTGVQAALANIETMINTSINAAAGFGSTQGRIETQSEFIGQLTEALRSGIGTLVDANMEEASARLQALQVQQQLGIQSLSIANQAPQTILSLFR
ncbi:MULTISPECIES: flagellin [unclassified Yoonia]|uniref:flagellin N-terminal helical domain-containing protein n=1 Tax=unclassified Yoonia TaxID=2629118 RepID=UPI002AFEDA74|nr:MULTISPECIES: flagellin [unclassified Yoonia]